MGHFFVTKEYWKWLFFWIVPISKWRNENKQSSFPLFKPVSTSAKFCLSLWINCLKSYLPHLWSAGGSGQIWAPLGLTHSSQVSPACCIVTTGRSAVSSHTKYFIFRGLYRILGISIPFLSNLHLLLH